MTLAWTPELREAARRIADPVDLASRPSIKPESAVYWAMQEFELDLFDVLSNRRETKFIKARAFVTWSLRTLGRTDGEPYSYPAIAKVLGKSCHSSVVQLHMRAIRLRLTDPFFLAACDRMTARFLELTEPNHGSH